jgi:L-ascorbate metabolism protein UlaG (beta-lactamase superfamily)
VPNTRHAFHAQTVSTHSLQWQQKRSSAESHMNIIYIYHSGFALQTERCNIVFDFYEDPAGTMTPILQSPKRLYVLTSHFHPDHFNPEVNSWSQRQGDTLYLLSKDILRHHRASAEAATAWMVKGTVYDDDFLHVQAFGSTDSGVSFYVETEGLKLFHAGDLNNWLWRDESTDAEVARAEKMYLGELKDICKVVPRLDVAFFPVDARMGTGYMRGAEQFIRRIPTRLFVPMHFSANGAESAQSFVPVASAVGTECWVPQAEGQKIIR